MSKFVTFQSHLAPLYRVRIDAGGAIHGDVVGVVTAVAFHARGRCLASVSWIANGAHHEEWFDEDRLEVVDE